MTAAAPPLPPAKAKPKDRGILRFVLVVFGVWLAGQVATQGMADYYAPKNPAAAVLWRADSGGALAKLAEQRLIAGDTARGASLARRALEQNPLDVRAISMLGVAWDLSGQKQAADQVMTLAGRLGWRDATTQLWLFAHRLQQGRYVEAFRRVDALLRRLDKYGDRLLAIVALEARKPEAQPALVERLKPSPTWRVALFGTLANDPRDGATDTTASLMKLLARTKAPPTDAEVGPYLRRLVASKNFAEADSALRTYAQPPLPAGEYVFDGGFEHGAGPTPFAWATEASAGSLVDISDAPNHGRALRVEYDGYSPAKLTKQMLLLQPGDYLLRGQAMSESGEGSERLTWAVFCGDRIIAQPNMGGLHAGQWTPFQIDVHIPPEGCPTEWLQLISLPGEHHLDMVLWYDNLSIRRNDTLQ